MHIIELSLSKLELFYHVVYNNKSGNILEMRIFSCDKNGLLEELFITSDFTIEYYMTIYNEMTGYIQHNLIDSISAE